MKPHWIQHGWVALLAWLAIGVSSTATAAERPNILFLLTDDQRRDALGCAGHPVLLTPHLDALARDGVRFRNAFVVEPTCAPSRTSILTGQYERVHQVGFSSQHALTDAQWAGTYPAVLRRAGYFTGFIGKFGVQRYAFRGRGERKFDFWQAHDGWARFWPKPLPHCAAYRDARADIITPIMAECVERFLQVRDRDKPFCLSVSFSAPHGSTSTTMDFPDPRGGGRDRWMTRPANELAALADDPIYGRRYRDRPIALPATFNDPLGTHLPRSIHDPLVGRINTYPYSFEQARCVEHHIRYMQLVHGVDAAVGRIVAALRQAGVADNTVIVFTSDHGLLMGEYGMGGKGLCYDLTAGVPLIVYDPRLPEPLRGRELDALVLSTDLAPTTLSLAGLEPPATMQGRDLAPLLHDRAEPWRDEIFLENLYLGRDGPLIEAVRTQRWKYVRYFNPGRGGLPGGMYPGVVDFAGRSPHFEQLFDLRADPQETSNLVAEAEHAAVVARLRKRCVDQSDELVRFARRQQVRAATER